VFRTQSVPIQHTAHYSAANAAARRLITRMQHAAAICRNNVYRTPGKHSFAAARHVRAFLLRLRRIIAADRVARTVLS